MRTRDVSQALVQWVREKPETVLRSPWRMSQDPWEILMGDSLVRPQVTSQSAGRMALLQGSLAKSGSLPRTQKEELEFRFRAAPPNAQCSTT